MANAPKERYFADAIANGHSLKRRTANPNRFNHESLDVTLAYLRGKDAESEEAQEHANSSSLALYA
jgi:hypothetical protein